MVGKLISYCFFLTSSPIIDDMFTDLMNSCLIRAAKFIPKNYYVRGNLFGLFLSNIFFLFDFYNYWLQAGIMGIFDYFSALFGLLVPSLKMKKASSS